MSQPGRDKILLLSSFTPSPVIFAKKINNYFGIMIKKQNSEFII